MDLKRSIMDSIKWLTIAKAIAQTVKWGVTFFVIRILEPEDYGLLAMAEAFMAYLALFSTAGMGAAIVRIRKYTVGQLRETLGLLIGINSLLCIIVMSTASFVSDFYVEPRLVPILMVLQIGFVIAMVETIPSALLIRKMEFRKISICEVCGSLIGAAVTLSLAMNSFGVWSLVYGFLAGSFSQAALKVWFEPIDFLPKFWISESRSLFSFGGIRTVASLFWVMLITVDIFIAGKIMDVATLGFYVVALQITRMPLTKFMPILKQVALPAYASVYRDDSHSVSQYFLRINKIAMVIVLPLFFGMSVTASLFVPVILGDKWAEAALPISLLALIVPLMVTLELIDPVLEAIGKPSTSLVNWLIAVLMMTPAIYIGTTSAGILGLSLSWVLVFPLVYGIVLLRSIKVVGASIVEFMGAIVAPAICAAVMFAVLYGFKTVSGDNISDLVKLLIIVPLGVVTYALSLFILDKAAMDEVIGVFRVST